MKIVLAELPFGARVVAEVRTHGAERKVERIAHRLNNLRPILESIAALMRKAFASRFRERGSPPWQQLAASTIARKSGVTFSADGRPPTPFVRRIPKHPLGDATAILVASGALRDSYTRKGATGHIEIIDEDNATVTVGSSLPYAAAQANGTQGVPSVLDLMGVQRATRHPSLPQRTAFHPGIPARPVNLTASDEAAITDSVREHLTLDA